MDDLIKRSEVKKIWCERFCHTGPGCPDGFCDEVNNIYDSIPAEPPAVEGWKLARWCFSEASDKDLSEAFGDAWEHGGYCNIAAMPFAYAYKKYTAWLENKIHVGDEVELRDGSRRGIVMEIIGDTFWAIVSNNGNSFITFSCRREIVKKTGRTFPEAVALMEKLKAGSDR